MTPRGADIVPNIIDGTCHAAAHDGPRRASEPRPPARARIDRVDVIPVDVPRVGGFALSRGQTPATSPHTVVRITTGDGVVGYGEGATQMRGLYTIVRDHLAPALVGMDAFDLTGVHARMDQVEMMVTERLAQWNVARCAIDMALYDAMGKALGVPVCSLLGGKQRDSFEIVKNVGIADPARSVEAAQQIVAEGCRCIKMRVGTDFATDLERVEAVRNAVGPDIRIRLDANQAWSPRQAVMQIQRLQDFGLEAVEQPCAYWDVRGSAEVVARVSVPIIADESFWTVHDAQVLLTAGAADVLHVYLGKCGGFFQSARIAAIAHGFGKAVTVGERVPLGIGEAAHAHFIAALARCDYPAEPAYDLNQHDLLAAPVRKANGRMYVPDGPGLGIEVDEDKLAYYARRDV